MRVAHQGWAWVALCLAFAVRIVDEALTDFLRDLQMSGYTHIIISSDSV